ncbi:unnamed protein product [Phaedon cochleariae]|uniref:Uncharacterized protein n=1 Tax=Phaedon cochleariae TaxID=80249 RepID=A0A9N9SJG2_PHACE|nr:unnamed protein product [Phaedon cochleariae]
MNPNSLICTSCNKNGHVANICQGSRQKFKSKPEKYKQVKCNQKSVIHCTQVSQESSDGALQEATSHQKATHFLGQQACGFAYPSSSFNLLISNHGQRKSSSKIPEAIMISVQVDGYMILMEVDSRAGVNVIHLECYKKLWATSDGLSPVHDLNLEDYNDNPVKIIGAKLVKVCYNEHEGVVPLLVVHGCKGHNLLGRNWFPTLGITVSATHVINKDSNFRASSVEQRRILVKIQRTTHSPRYFIFTATEVFQSSSSSLCIGS